MAKVEPPSEYHREFIARTIQARCDSGYTQDDIATILGIPQTTYKWYETRTPLPHRFIPAFCAATHVSETWLFTGRARRRNAA